VDASARPPDTAIGHHAGAPGSGVSGCGGETLAAPLAHFHADAAGALVAAAAVPAVLVVIEASPAVSRPRKTDVTVGRGPPCQPCSGPATIRRAHQRVQY